MIMIDDYASTGCYTTRRVQRTSFVQVREEVMDPALVGLFSNGDTGRGITVVSPSRREAIQSVPANQHPYTKLTTLT